MYFLPISSFPRNPVDFEGDYKYGLLTSVKGSLICSSISFKFHHQNSVLLSIIRSIRQPECKTPIKKKKKKKFVQCVEAQLSFSSVTQSCLTLRNPMDCSTLGLPVHHQLPEFTQIHVH